MSTSFLFNKGEKIGLISCSDGVKQESFSRVEELIIVLNSMGLEVSVARTLMRRSSFFSGSPRERADELNKFFRDDEIKAIFDISGGDSANQILPFLDYGCIRNKKKPFFGLSDLSVILNSLFVMSVVPSMHYQVMNLISSCSNEQRNRFYNTFFKGEDDLFKINYSWIRGKNMEGVVIGGNIRCFLKLSGTHYFPDPSGNIIFLESLGGRANRIVSLIAQLSQIGYFDACTGLILGSFTESELNNEYSIIEDYITEVTNHNLPIIKTEELGHGDNSKCIEIGRKYIL